MSKTDFVFNVFFCKISGLKICFCRIKFFPLQANRKKPISFCLLYVHNHNTIIEYCDILWIYVSCRL